MVYLYIILAVLLLCVTVLITVPVRVIADYANGDYNLKVRIFGINIDPSVFAGKSKDDKKTKRQKAQPEHEPQDEALFAKINNSIKLVRRIRNVYNDSRHFVSKRFYADNIYVNISFGTWDAALTGIATGALWTLLYEVLGLLTTISTVNHHKFTVDTVYDRSFFDIKAGAVLKFRIIGVAGIAICLFYNLRKYKE